MKGLDAFDEMLRQTLEDGVLSRSEDRVLRMVMEDLSPSPRELDVLRARAFAIAEESLPNETAREIARWLRRVLAAIDSARPDEPERSAPEAWFSPIQDCVGRIVQWLDQSRATLDICVFTITDNRVARAITAAHARGVRVRVLSDDDKSEDLGSDVERLDTAGVDVRLDTSPHHMHHKFAISDSRQLLTGSYNWTRSASTSNEENFLITGEPTLIESFQSEFDRLWNLHG